MKYLSNTWTEVNLAATAHNIRTIKKIVGNKVKVLGVIKSDAYGHGMIEVARVLIDEGAHYLGVSSVNEGITLRRFFEHFPILILSAGMFGYESAIVSENLTPVVCSYEMVDAIEREAKRQNKIAKVHIVIDTGMGRIGVWHETCHDFIKYTLTQKNINVEGICTHFSSINESDFDYSYYQLNAFKKILVWLEEQHVNIPLIHMAGSGGILQVPDAHFTMVRPGIMQHGLYPNQRLKEKFSHIGLQPSLSVLSKVAFLRVVDAGRTVSYARTYCVKEKTRIATLPVGYTHGFFRAFSNVGEVLIRGQRMPVVGTVTMDQMMVNVGLQSDVTIGDRVVILGAQEGARLTAEEISLKINTTPYDVVCSLTRNVPRYYVYRQQESFAGNERTREAFAVSHDTLHEISGSLS